MTDSKPKTKALVVATRCSTVEQFVSTFYRFCDDSTFFVATLASRPVGLETAFSIQLEDKTPVLRGLCHVVEAWSTPANRYGRPGVRLGVKRLTNESLVVFKQLQTARKAAEAADAAKAAEPAARPPEAPVAAPPPPPKLQLPPLRPIPRATPPAIPIVAVPAKLEPVPAPPAPAPPEPAPPEPAPPEPVQTAQAAELDRYVPEPIAASDDLTNPVATETRTPGSSFILPANPLMNLTDQSLEGFVDCALYEETGNFFRAPEYEDSPVDDDDPIAPPPPARPGVRTLTPINALRPNAFVPPTHDDESFAPEHTPVPMLAGLSPSGSVRAETPPPMPEMPRGGRAPTPPVFDQSQGMFSDEHTRPPTRPPPAPLAMPLPAQSQPVPMAMVPTVSFDSTASLIAINQKRDRKRWLVIGGVAAGVSLLLLVIVLATSGGGGDGASAATTPAPPAPQKPAIASTPTPDVETQPAKPRPPVTDPTDEAPVGDPDAPPVAGSGPCRVTVTSSPAGSMVQVDDQPLGPSPITIAGPCARRKIDVKHPRYALGTKWVTLTVGKPETVDIALARPTHSVTVTSSPSGATVSIAGRRAGTTPTAVKVMGFTGVSLTVEKLGFKTVTQKLYSKVDGGTVSVKLLRGR